MQKVNCNFLEVGLEGISCLLLGLQCTARELSLSHGSPFTFAGRVLSWQLWPLGWGGQVQYQWLRQTQDFVVPVFLL